MRQFRVLLVVIALGAGTACGDDSSQDVSAAAGGESRPLAQPSPPPPTPDDVEETEALGPGSWMGARTSRDGRSLVLVIIGGPAYRAGDHCTVDYRADVTETESEVRLRIVARRPKPSGDYSCNTRGHSRLIEVGLAQPFGDRRLVEEQFAREQPVFDGSHLLDPGWLPGDWSLLHEAPGYPEPESVRYWSRTWGQPSPPPTDDHCTPSPTPVTLTQGPADRVERYPSNGERPTDRYEVRGQDATYYTGGSANITRLAWTEGDRGYVLASGDRCVGDTPPTPELLVRIANSLWFGPPQPSMR
jgi:hypothetical protein